VTMAPLGAIPRFSAAGEPAGTMEVPAVFAGRPHRHAVWLAVTVQLANKRAGTHATKTRGEVSGGGKKPWRQKHTGRARQGSTRAPQWRHGGTVFGPRPRSHAKEAPRSLRRLALRSALAAKIRSGAVAVAEPPAFEAPKTRHAAAWLRTIARAHAGVLQDRASAEVAPLRMSGARTLVLLAGRDAMAERAFRNLADTRILHAAHASAYDVIAAARVIVTPDALAALAKRCADGAGA
jgi:large subunit ribosomal protein L4